MSLFQIHETIETINQLKTQREFMLSFARDPQGFINDWLQSQCRDLKVSPPIMTSHSQSLICNIPDGKVLATKQLVRFHVYELKRRWKIRIFITPFQFWSERSLLHKHIHTGLAPSWSSLRCTRSVKSKWSSEHLIARLWMPEGLPSDDELNNCWPAVNPLQHQSSHLWG